MPSTPRVRQVVLDTTDPRGLAEFYRQLLGYVYRPGDEPPADSADDSKGRDWLVLRRPDGDVGLSFQYTEVLPRSTWPDSTVPQQLHLDCTVSTMDELNEVRRHALTLGATERFDRSHDPDEPLYVFADPAGHPFCVFVGDA